LLATFLSPSLSSSSSQKQANKSPISKRISSLFPQVFALESPRHTQNSLVVFAFYSQLKCARERATREADLQRAPQHWERKRRDKRRVQATLYLAFFGYVINSIEVGLLLPFRFFSFAIFFNVMDFASQPGVFFFSFVNLKVFLSFAWVCAFFL
jgi:hypothetical protein